MVLLVAVSVVVAISALFVVAKFLVLLTPGDLIAPLFAVVASCVV